MTAPFSRRDIPVHVSVHARERSLLRFPTFKRARIIDEVRDGMANGRFSAMLPDGITTTSTRADALYVWSVCGERVYAIEVDAVLTDGSQFVVTTVLRRGWNSD